MHLIITDARLARSRAIHLSGTRLVLAGLAARGTTVITHPAHIDRGYAGFTEILAGLGAQIRRESATENGTVKKTSAKKQICLAIGAKR